MNADNASPEVLVIDDETQIRRLLRVTLESAGYRVREVDSGLAGLTEVSFQRPDAIILDLGLPDISGGEVLRRLREWSQAPVLVLSVLGRGRAENRARSTPGRMTISQNPSAAANCWPACA